MQNVNSKKWPMVLLVQILLFGLVTGLLSCSSQQEREKPASRDEVQADVTLKKDRDDIAELRKNIPEEVKRSNDRLADILNRWKQHKTSPEDLREKFDDEIRKVRQDFEKKISRRREDFDRHVADKRKAFQEQQKEARDDFFASKPKSDKRSDFMERQSVDRDRFNSDIRDERDEFEDAIREQRKDFESKMADKRTEFRQEYPEYIRIYNEMKNAEERARETQRGQPYNGWPYKPNDAPRGPQQPVQKDVNSGGDGWPATDPAELNQVPNPPKQGL